MPSNVESEARPVAMDPSRAPVPSRRRFSWWRTHPFATLALLILIVGGTIAGIRLWAYFSSYESTDDAEVDGHIYPITSRIGGRVVAVLVDSDQPAAAGQPLVQLDTTDYEIAAARANADLLKAQADVQAARTQVPITSTSTASQLSTAQAGVAEAQAGIAAAQEQYNAAQARIREAEANYKRAQDDVNRLRPLAEKQEISAQQYEAATSAATAMAAAVDTARANADAAARNIAAAQARLGQARALEQATASSPQQVAATRARVSSQQAAAQANQTALQQAKLNLQYTKVVSPVDGIVGKRNVEPGQQVQAGQDLMQVVPVNDLWVTANFKETQFGPIHIGQRATIHVDALRRDFNAHVDSFPATTGARSSLLPPENATGNFVKVVQRLPVKIVFEPGQDNEHKLRPGMSVEVKIWLK